MVTRDDVQSFLDRLDGGGMAPEEVEPGLWRVSTPEGAEVVVSYSPPVALLRVRVMPLPQEAEKQTELFRQLLEFNARDLVHGSYGIEGDHIVLTDALELADLDYSEFAASFDSMTLALATHVGALAPFRDR